MSIPGAGRTPTYESHMFADIASKNRRAQSRSAAVAAPDEHAGEALKLLEFAP